MTQAVASCGVDAVGRTELNLDFRDLEGLTKRFEDPALIYLLKSIPGRMDIAALVAQAIADNFAKETGGYGPWAPLKGATIRQSVALNKMTKAMIKDAKFNAADKMGAIKQNKKTGKRMLDQKRLLGNKKRFFELVDKEIEKVERTSREYARKNPGDRGEEALGNRQILQRTKTLFKTVTTPGAAVAISTKHGVTVSGQGIRRVEGSNLIWGTNLVYAAAHNEGTKKIPKREFLVLRKEWQDRLTRYVSNLMVQEIAKRIGG